MRYFYYIISIITITTFTACDKVIDLKLNTSPVQIVIQGNLYDRVGMTEVSITESKDFDDDGEYDIVSDAVVVISDNFGNIDTLKYQLSGTYASKRLRGVEGRTYTLSVQRGGKEYKASSTIYNPVTIDSLYIEKSGFGDQSFVSVDFTDSKSRGNYYRLVQFVNSKQLSGFNVTSNFLKIEDELTYTFYSNNRDDVMKAGDELVVWVETIDQGVYDYFRTAGNFGNPTVTPTNPLTNFSNGALGYFNACAIQQKTITLIDDY